ncbi:synaptobrevin-domain-containing protein [Mycena galopus ATCC 62051]|nr:synaptobrevin-domain-containing protein [Mycena galopus ATCC 62051]
MSLIHALVARESTILAEHQAGKRNFSQATEKILSKIPPNDSKLTYVWEEFLFHYISEGGFTYLVMADDSAGRRMPFAFLADLQRKHVLRWQWGRNSATTVMLPAGGDRRSFCTVGYHWCWSRQLPAGCSGSSQGALAARGPLLVPFGAAGAKASGWLLTSRTPSLRKFHSNFFFAGAASSSASTDTPAHGLQGSFGPVIADLMHTYNTAPPADELARAQTELNQVKNIMVQNVEQILSRGERIELLVDKTDVMAGQATAFRRGARNVRRQMWWRNTKIMALCVLVGLVFLWIFIAQFCGAGLNQCGSKKSPPPEEPASLD